jgi:hypothetical protein
MADATDLAIQLVQEAVGHDPSAHLDVKWSDGRKTEYTVSEFRAAARPDMLRGLRAINAWVWGGEGEMSVSIAWEKVNGASLIVRGENVKRIQAAGVLEELRRSLDTGRRWANWDESVTLIGLIGAMPFAVASLLSVVILPDTLAVAVALGAICCTLMIAAVLMAVVPAVFVPRLEILDRDEASRSRTWALRAGKVASYLATAVIGALIGRLLG